MKLVIAEKPSVAQSIARIIGAAGRKDGYLEGNGYLVSWCVGHLVELSVHIPRKQHNRSKGTACCSASNGIKPVNSYCA